MSVAAHFAVLSTTVVVVMSPSSPVTFTPAREALPVVCFSESPQTVRLAIAARALNPALPAVVPTLTPLLGEAHATVTALPTSTTARPPAGAVTHLAVPADVRPKEASVPKREHASGRHEFRTAFVRGVQQILGGFVGASPWARDDRPALTIAMTEIRDAVQAAKRA